MQILINSISARFIIGLIVAFTLSSALISIYDTEVESLDTDSSLNVAQRSATSNITATSNGTTTGESQKQGNIISQSTSWVKDNTVNRLNWDLPNPGEYASNLTSSVTNKLGLNKGINALNQLRNWTSTMTNGISAWKDTGTNVPFFNIIFLTPIGIMVAIIFVRAWVIGI